MNKYLVPIILSAWVGHADAQPTSSSLENYQRLDFTLPGNIERLLIVDANNDGLADILSIAEKSIGLYFQSADTGFDFSQPSTTVTFEGRSIGWDLSDNYVDAAGVAHFSLLALVDGNRVLQWPIVEGQFAAPIELLSGLNGFSGAGINRLRFSRDLNDDNREDLIIPNAGTLQLFIRNEGNRYQPPISVVSDMRNFTNLYIQDSLERDVGQTISIPSIELRDVNNDGRPDLISETEERFDVSLANNDGDYFPQTPTYTVDREEIRPAWQLRFRSTRLC